MIMEMTKRRPHGAAVLFSAVLLLCGASCGRRAETGPVLRTHTSRIRGFDPVKAGDVASMRAMCKIYEGLLQYDYTSRPYRVQPCLAEALPEVSDDGLTYRFRLRGDARFQDDPCFPDGQGRRVRADDVVYAILRVADARNASPGYWAFRDRLVGLDDWRARTARGEEGGEVEGLVAEDERTVRIRLTAPYPQLLWVLAMHYASVVPREAVEYYGEAFTMHPVGTGPFRLKAWRRNHRLVFERNPAWTPGASETIMRPALDGIIEYVVDDPTTRWLMLLNNQLDVLKDVSRDWAEVILTPEGALKSAWLDKGLRADVIEGLDTYYVGFNMDDPVVGTNRLLRQALTLAFDAEAWRRFHGGRVIPATGPIPPGVAGHLDRHPLGGYHPERARRLLAEAGYPEGIDPATGRRLELTIELGHADTEMRESTELLATFFERIGVRLIPQYNTQPAFFKKIERRQAQLFRLSWFADYPDGQNFLQLFYGPNASPGPNRVNYNNPDYDRLYEKASAMADTPERTEGYRRLARMIAEDAPWLFLHHPADFTLRSNRLEGYRPTDFPYGVEKYYRLRSDGPIKAPSS